MDQIQKPPQDLPRIREITAALQQSLSDPSCPHERLQHQADLLNNLMATILSFQTHEKIGSGWNSTYEWLELALRVQKQCVDTLKARATIDYLQTLSAPRPPKHDERIK